MTCPHCKKPLMIWCAMQLAEIAATCMTAKCPLSEIVGQGATEADAIEDFERKAGKEMGKS